MWQSTVRDRQERGSVDALSRPVWDYSFDPQTNVIDVLVFRLREKVDRDFPTRLIHTIRGSGYVLRVA